MNLSNLGTGFEAVKYLVETGSDVNAFDEKGETALMREVRESCPDPRTIVYLLGKGANLKALNKKGLSAKNIAEKKGHFEVARSLETLEN